MIKMNNSIADVARGAPVILPGSPPLNEVATYEGVFKHDGHIVHEQSLHYINRETVRRVINTGLQETLLQHFYDDKGNAKFFVADDYDGVGVLEGIYLDIVSVVPKRQDNGTGRALMHSFLQTTDGRLAFRSQPKRTVANDWYSKFARLISQETNVDGVLYNMYGVGLTLPEQEAWLSIMRNKPKNFE